MQSFTSDEHGRFASPELFGLHFARFKVVAHVFAHPDLFLTLDAHLSVGNCFSGGRVEGNPFAGHHAAAVFDQNPVSAGRHPRPDIVFTPTLVVQRFNFVAR